MIGIYKITNPNGKVYIGQSINIEKRFKGYKSLRCKNQVALYRSFLKYGIEKHIFEIIEECSIELLNEKERYYQDFYNVLEIGLNCKTTSFNSKTGSLSEDTKNKIKEKATGRKASKETKLKMSLSRKGIKSPMLGKIHSEETKLKISKYNIGKTHSIKTKEKISKSNLGRLSPMIGKKHKEETKLKMSLSLIGNKRSLNKKKSQKNKDYLKNIFSKIILNTQTGIFYTGTKEASFYNNIPQSTLRSKLNGNLKNNTNLIYC